MFVDSDASECSQPVARGGDREVVRVATQQNGRVLESASLGLHDRELVFEAVRRDGSSLWYASEDLRGDREVVLVAIQQNGKAW